MLRSDIQKLEVGSLVCLIEVDGSEFDAGVLYFHGHNIAYKESEIESLVNPLFINNNRIKGDDIEGGGKNIIWQGVTYTPWPCSLEGISVDSSGKSSNPTLSVGNMNGMITALCLITDDMVQAKVTIRWTLAKYLDSANFETPNPYADPTQEVVETFYIDSKTSEDNEVVVWSLSSPADVSGQIIPTRIITGMCEWCMRGQYRGADCGYTGSAMFDIDNNPVTNPELDRCGGLISSCKVRFGETSELPFGGYPSSNLLGR